MYIFIYIFYISVSLGGFTYCEAHKQTREATKCTVTCTQQHFWYMRSRRGNPKSMTLGRRLGDFYLTVLGLLVLSDVPCQLEKTVRTL